MAHTAIITAFAFRETRKFAATHASNRQPVLKSQHFYLLLALAACRDQGTTCPELAVFAGVSMSEVHGALKRDDGAVTKKTKIQGRALGGPWP